MRKEEGTLINHSSRTCLEFLFLAILLNQSAIAQEKVWVPPARVFWVTLGAGFIGSSHFWGASGYLGMSFDSNVGLLSLRTSIGATGKVSPSDDGVFEIPITSITDLGVMYGVCNRSTNSIFSASAGIGLVWTKEESTTDDLGMATIGIPLEVQAVIIPLPILGIGLKAYGNLNINNSFGGLLVCLHFSKFREIESPSK